MFKVVAGAFGIYALAACASSPSTTVPLAESMAAVRGAETAGAANVPEAALHLKLAQENISQAEKLADDDAERSNGFAMRAFADAELALALTREADSRQAVSGYAEGHPNVTPQAGTGATDPSNPSPPQGPETVKP